MYAALVRLTIDETEAPAAARAFSDRILPEIQAIEGLVAGYWVDPEDEEGFGFVVFESKEQAQRVQVRHFDWSAPGVEIIEVAVRRVAVSIP